MRLFLSVFVAGCLLLSFSAVGSAVSETQDEEAAARDLKTMQGVWKLESAMDNGESVPFTPRLVKLTFTIKNNLLIPSDDAKAVQTLKLDPTKMPAEVDMTEKETKTYKGIYKLGEDGFTLCFSEGGERPKTFDSTKDNRAVLLVLKRVKK